MDRPAPACQRGTEGPCHELGDSVRVRDHPRPLGDRPGHTHLVDLLHGAGPEPVLGCAAHDVDDRGPHVTRHGQPWNGIGVSRGREQAHTGRAGDARPGCGHTHRRLLVPCVDETDPIGGHDVHKMECVVACQCKGGVNPLCSQRSDYKMGACQLHRGHLRAGERPNRESSALEESANQGARLDNIISCRWPTTSGLASGIPL